MLVFLMSIRVAHSSHGEFLRRVRVGSGEGFCSGQQRNRKKWILLLNSGHIKWNKWKTHISTRDPGLWSHELKSRWKSGQGSTSFPYKICFYFSALFCCINKIKCNIFRCISAECAVAAAVGTNPLHKSQQSKQIKIWFDSFENKYKCTDANAHIDIHIAFVFDWRNFQFTCKFHRIDSVQFGIFRYCFHI